MAGVTFAKRTLLHEKDPGDVIKDAVGDLTGFEVFHNLILIGIYKAPEKTAGGIFRPESSKKEDVFQGVVGHVLKVGPAAFKDDENNKFYGVEVKEGDWIVYRPSDTWMTSVNGQECRVLEDAKVKARVAHPDLVF